MMDVTSYSFVCDDWLYPAGPFGNLPLQPTEAQELSGELVDGTYMITIRGFNKLDPSQEDFAFFNWIVG